MIGYLKGIIIEKTSRAAILEVNGVGYEVFVLPLFLEKAAIGEPAEFYTHLHVREDIMELFGFARIGELNFFKKLISVSGVGPKSALTIMSLASVEELQKGIARGDSSMLIKVSGIGKKTAERLIVELKSKMEVIDDAGTAGGYGSLGDSQAIDGLIGLGYTAREAREALRSVDQSITGTKDRIKAALKSLGKRE